MRERRKKVVENEIEETGLDADVFQTFVNRFKARYGEKSMNAETMLLFLEKCADIPSEHFETVTDLMIGKKDRVFGWCAIVDTYNAMYNSPEMQETKRTIALKDNYNKTNQGHGKILMKLMAELISKISSKNIGNGWKLEFAQNIYDVVGDKQARDICRSLSNEGVFGDFKKILLDLLDYRENNLNA